MSSLTEEQKKRIAENRAKALEKLAQKRALGQQQHSNASATKGPSTSFYNKSQPNTFNSGTTQKQGNIVNLQRFEYHRRTSETSYKATTKAPVKRTKYTQSTFSSSSNSGNTTKAWNATKRGNAPNYKTANDASTKTKVVRGTCVLISKTRFKVVVGFHAKLIGVLKSIPSSCYDNQTRTWTFHLEDYETLMSLCKPLAKEVALSGFPKDVSKLFLSGKKKNCSETEIEWDRIDKKLVDSLMPFQREGVVFSIKQNGRVLLADDMGLGKTIQAIAVAAYYRPKWPLLIVVPSSLRMTWRRALVRWVPSLQPQEVNVVFTGKDNPNIGLVNIISYDLMAKKIKEIQKVGYKVVILDECHFIKNYKAERTKATMPLLKAASHVILVSGTPALSRPVELYTQISAVNSKLFPSYHQYGVRYCSAVKNKFGWDYSGSSNLEELQLILEECIMIRRLKKAVLDQLPSKTREIVYLDPVLIKEKALAKFEKKLVNAESTTQRSALLTYFSETSAAKEKAAREYIFDLLEGGHKMIVFAHHMVMLDAICEALLRKKIGYIRIDGKTMSARRQHLCDQFQRDEETRIAVLSITAANTGLTLTAATSVVFAELFWNPGVLVQAEDRAYRIGQKNSVVIHYLLASKTADDYLWPLIQKKLEVLNEAGLNKESFSDLDTKRFKDPRQRDLKDLFECVIEEFKDDDSLLEECLKGEKCSTECDEVDSNVDAAGCSTSENKNENAKLWSENSDGGESSQTRSLNKADSCQGGLMIDLSEEWFDDIDDDWDDVLESTVEPNAKRKRL